jgi:anti-anti-sigma factor
VSIINVPTLSAGKPSDHRNDHTDHQIAGFSTRWARPSTAVVTVCGELDAGNARQFTEYALGHISCSKELILDLTAVKFFAVSCFPVLHNLNMRCAREGVDWALIPSTAVSRALRVCDPHGQLPTMSTTVAASLSRLQRNWTAAGAAFAV